MIDSKDIQHYLKAIKRSKDANIPTAATAKDFPSRDHQQNKMESVNTAASINISIDPSCDIRGIGRMRFGANVVIQKDCWLNIAFNNPAPGPMIVISEGTNIGRRCTLSAANKIHVGKYVLFAPNVFIADTHHQYQKIGIPIMHQGITTATDEIIIGDESWIGINSVIMGNVSIGKHCVIGANSVVTKDIPDYCIAVGNPVEVIKTFNFKTGQWVRVKSKSDLEKYLVARKSNESVNVTQR